MAADCKSVSFTHVDSNTTFFNIMEGIILFLINEYCNINEKDINRMLSKGADFENGISNTRFYLEKGCLIAKEAFFAMNEKNQRGAKLIDHVSYLYQISNEYYMLCNFTSHEYYPYGGKRYKNLKLEDSIYRYVTPMILVDVDFLLNFTDQTKGREFLPESLKNTEDDVIIQDTIEGFIDSFNFTMKNGKAFKDCQASTMTLHNYRMLQISSKEMFINNDCEMINDFKETIRKELFIEDRIQNMKKDLNSGL